MKLLVFSDVHGNLDALERFEKEAEWFTTDIWIFLGDIFGYYYEQIEIIRKFKKYPNLIWLKGNHDQYAVNIFRGRENENYYIGNFGSSYKEIRYRYSEAEIKEIEKKNFYEVFDSGYEKICCVHGTILDPSEGRLYPNDEVKDIQRYQDYSIVFQGHTHWRMFRKQGNTVIINPGSLGQPRDGGINSFTYIDTFKRKCRFISLETNLYRTWAEVEKRDPSLYKLKKVIHRYGTREKNICNRYQW